MQLERRRRVELGGDRYRRQRRQYANAGYLTSGIEIIKCRLDGLATTEPAEGLAPVIVDDNLAEQLGLLRAERLTMMISEQNLTFARALADRAYVMESGCIRHHGTLAELNAEPDSWTKFIAF